MTVETVDGGGDPILSSGPYNGNGVTADFDYDFQIQDETDLLVTRQNADLTETVLTLTTQYTVSGVGSDTGGSITLVDPATDLATGTKLLLTYKGSFTQTVDYSNQGRIQLSLLENSLDRITMHLRELKEETSRAITFDAFGSNDAQTFSDAVTQIKGDIDNLVQLKWFGPWAASTAYLVNNIVHSGNNSYICVEAHTSGISFGTDLAAGKWEIMAQGTGGAPTLYAEDLSANGNITIDPNGTGKLILVSGALELPNNGSIENIGSLTFTTTDAKFPNSMDFEIGRRLQTPTGVAWMDLETNSLALNANGGKLSLTSDGILVNTNGVRIDGFLDEDDMASDDPVKSVTQQSVKAYVDRVATAGTSAVVSTASGSTADVTGLPADVVGIIITFNGVSTNGTNVPELRIGDSGGLEATGYTGRSINMNGLASLTHSAGFRFSGSFAAAWQLYGQMELWRHEGSSNTWSFRSQLVDLNSGQMIFGCGVKALTGVLDRFSLVTADTFDGGDFNYALIRGV